ncbi:hypothetical protein [Peloplasma aerotolerans]|uniref:Resolvase/invertase-type recombinase catalytic domain-containing protein n=1 Tax=Peloplasma aerotolerans TaxID=3044389 RepID=A0AAW6UAS3_9MOLU|nr:hypothetical protein [Mariniplasma sp. M4Ah]MDI6453034.1 hypothetical protein [Mariniplasma sp. M4Ah]MDR4968235.1 hypothetical protein [Acholeplasmataceae bacterium]
MAIDGYFKGLSYFGLLEELNELIVKDIDLIYIKEVNEVSDTLSEINAGIVFSLLQI